VSASEQRGQHRVDDRVLSDDGLRDHRLQLDDRLARPREKLHTRSRVRLLRLGGLTHREAS
jgi:hypothetical protein